MEDESDDEYVYDGNDDGYSSYLYNMFVDDGSGGSTTGSDDDEGSEEENSDTDQSGESDNAVSADVAPSSSHTKTGEHGAPKTVVSEAYPMDISNCEMPTEAEKRTAASSNLSDRICMLCLGEQNNLNDELIECDACKIVVHEGLNPL